MWVYRIKCGEYQNTEFARPLAQIFKIIEGSRLYLKTEFPIDNAHTLQQSWAEAQRLWRMIGWDGSISGEARSFLVPGPLGYNIGFHVVSLTRLTFIASPYPLPHVQETLDWDAFTDSKETHRARSLIINGEADEITQPNIIKWTRNKKGNLVSFHENSTLTVFPDNRGGWRACVSFGDLRQFTLTKKTEAEAAAYVIEHYERLKRELTPQPLDPNDLWVDD